MGGQGGLSFLARRVAIGQDNAHGLPNGGFIAIDVRDTGTGIPPEVLAHIFEPFFTTKEAGKGTGLGLATVQGIVNQSGGAVEVSSTLGVGTTFTLLLPIAEGEDVSVGAPDEEGHPTLHGRGEHLLVVEDDSAVRRLMHAVLSRAGYLVTLASNGAEALFIATQPGFTIDAVVTDIEMPLLNGIELVTRLTATSPRLKRLFVSAATENHPLPPGAASLGKPFSRRDLLTAVTKLFTETA